MTFFERYRNLPLDFGTRSRLGRRMVGGQCLRPADQQSDYPVMLNDLEKEELKRIVNKFVEQRRCFRPVDPDEVIRQVNRFKQTEDGSEDDSLDGSPRFQV